MITITATYIKHTVNAWYLNCEGDNHWFPKSQVEYNKETSTLQLPEWLYKEKFPDEPI